MNPYQPPIASANKTVGSTRWIRGFLILNGVLMAIPVLIALFTYVSLKIEFAMQPNNINGDPVTYQHELVSVPGSVWPIVAFFLVPNLILLTKFTLSAVGQRRGASG
ncbi:hypothetical protein K227x_33080 [Rubripirellula lacrimiformis]|uniref:Uncharacterized protein n=1 Tax=Rubripirellula lacrimiformis TaxID=1930273 RepID=A0A517NCS7_9BACT|nr:hypothetical protein [Rubripirellula lacrimiformis]QDT04911.1 hypothetical protein K227x_33080 [Rubripirellula lacrimiformis]